MKRIIIAIVFVSVAAFHANSQVKFGVQAGGQIASINSKEDGKDVPGKKSIVGFKLGGIASVPITSKISFMPELNFVKKGGKFSNTTTIDLGATDKIISIAEQEIKPSFIEVPLNIAYTASGKNGTGFFGGLGPVVSLGLGGSASADVTVSTTIDGNTTTKNSSQSGTIKFDGENNTTDGRTHMKSFELGGDVFAGYKMANGLFAKVTYNIGFSDLSTDAHITNKNSYYGISIGYFF